MQKGRERNDIDMLSYMKELFAKEEKQIRSNIDYIFPPDANDPTPTAQMSFYEELAYRERKFNEKRQEK